MKYILAAAALSCAAAFAQSDAPYSFSSAPYHTSRFDNWTGTDTAVFDAMQRDTARDLTAMMRQLVAENRVNRQLSWSGGGYGGGIIVYPAHQERGQWVREYMIDIDRTPYRMRLIGYLCAAEPASWQDLHDCGSEAASDERPSRQLYGPKESAEQYVDMAVLDDALYRVGIVWTGGKYDRGSVHDVTIRRRGADGSVTGVAGLFTYDRGNGAQFLADMSNGRVTCVDLGVTLTCRPVPTEAEALREVAERPAKEAREREAEARRRAADEKAEIAARGPCIEDLGIRDMYKETTYVNGFGQTRTETTPQASHHFYRNSCKRTIAVTESCTMIVRLPSNTIEVAPGEQFDTPAYFCRVVGK